MKATIDRVVIVGGGTAGWMAAALIARVIGPRVTVTLVESEEIGIVGVGEATIPPIQHVNAVLGLDEAEFLRETRGTIKLAIRFDDWRALGQSYYHTFGAAGRNTAFCSFHHYWARARRAGVAAGYWDYDLNYLAAREGKFAKIQVGDPMWQLPYAYHFDSSLYGQYLRRYSERAGVTRIEGMVADVRRHDNGDIAALVLKDGREVAGDLFVDCSGARGLLIQRQLNVGYEDWSHWLPCDRAMAVPTARHDATPPYTRSTARTAGWQWRIPLQHRVGNGLVYSSRHLSDDAAAELLLGNLDGKVLGDPRIIPFRTGRARRQWDRNVVAVGLSSGFLEPLESTSIYLIQSAIVRLLHHFPHAGIQPAAVAEYNRQSRIEFETVRDFIILHYHATSRNDSPFWRDVRAATLPDRLAAKIELFRATGALTQDPLDIFMEPSWVQVLMGQGIEAADYHPLADETDLGELTAQLDQLAAMKREPVPNMPAHDQWLRAFGGTAA
ncbi:tryptophan halogenase family protein [Sphingomonas yantingensis]|uniref:Tryptophan halogenase n=1 Tax=Sphingomonas yantingensis TaxID=1241761 RepID=A0A7W9AQ53_9SPHN|nr:tryptophan halogenase family protein [Sphingomonas yantingensis]MBB5698559.1 tryptophan halogenase [Sphingomonas yantingensis]